MTNQKTPEGVLAISVYVTNDYGCKLHIWASHVTSMKSKCDVFTLKRPLGVNQYIQKLKNFKFLKNIPQTS